MSRVCAAGRCPLPVVARVRIHRPHPETHLVCREHHAQVMARTDWRPELLDRWTTLAELEDDPRGAAASQPAAPAPTTPTETPMSATVPLPSCALPGCDRRATSARKAFCSRCNARVRALEADPEANVPEGLWRVDARVSDHDCATLGAEWQARRERVSAAQVARARAQRVEADPSPAEVEASAPAAPTEDGELDRPLSLAERAEAVLGAEVATGTLYGDLEQALDRIEELERIIRRHADQGQVYLGVLDAIWPGRDFAAAELQALLADADRMRRQINAADVIATMLGVESLVGAASKVAEMKAGEGVGRPLVEERQAHANTRHALAAAQAEVVRWMEAPTDDYRIGRAAPLLALLDRVMDDAADEDGIVPGYRYAAGLLLSAVRRELGLAAASDEPTPSAVAAR